MKKISILLSLFLLFSALNGLEVFAGPSTYYVAVDGNDNNPGTMDAPVATLSKAVELAKSSDNATVYMRGGTYQLTETVEIDKELSNLTITAYGNEEVIMTGAKKLDGALFRKVTDESVLERIVDKKARENVVSIDLKAQGITEFGSVNIQGHSMPGFPGDPQLLVNGKTQTLARYPDDDYLYINTVSGLIHQHEMDGKSYEELLGKGFTATFSDSRLKKWEKAEDPFMFGYPIHDWANVAVPCVIDAKNNAATSTYPSRFGAAQNGRIYFFNLLEEISTPGEWYLDRTTGVLYLYPEENMSSANVEFYTFDKPVFRITGTENITIKNISMEKTVYQGIVVLDSENIDILNCKFDHISHHVIRYERSSECVVDFCEFTEIGGCAIDYYVLDATKNLKSSNTKFTNNLIKGFQRIYTTHYPAIWARGVGITVAHNEISDGTNTAIWFGGNDNVIEYNDIYNVCTDTADAGAIYAGYSWRSRGNEVRYNYIHDMKKINTMTGMKVQAIYLDDLFSSAKVYGNVIKDVPSVALYGGGRYNTFENNIIINCQEPFVYDARGTTWFDCSQNSSIMSDLLSVNYKEGIWAEKYPELATILEDEPAYPKHSVIKNNISMNSPGYNLDPLMIQYGEVKDDYTIKANDFVDFKNGNLNLKEDSQVFVKLSEFKAIPFDKIGIEEKPKEMTSEDVLKTGVALMVNNPKTFVFGAETAIDVAPTIENDRTLVPVRFIAESFGAEVSWNEETKEVGVNYGDIKIQLTLEQKEMYINGEKNELDVPAKSINGRTMLPLRAVVEALGKNVFWDARGLIFISDEVILNESEVALVNTMVSLFN